MKTKRSSLRNSIVENNETKNGIFSSSLTDIKTNNGKMSVSTDGGKTFENIGVSEDELTLLNNKKIDKSSITQTTGSSVDAIMSQKATTDELTKKFDNSNYPNYDVLYSGNALNIGERLMRCCDGYITIARQSTSYPYRALVYDHSFNCVRIYDLPETFLYDSNFYAEDNGNFYLIILQGNVYTLDKQSGVWTLKISNSTAGWGGTGRIQVFHIKNNYYVFTGFSSATKYFYIMDAGLTTVTAVAKPAIVTGTVRDVSFVIYYEKYDSFYMATSYGEVLRWNLSTDTWYYATPMGAPTSNRSCNGIAIDVVNQKVHFSFWADYYIYTFSANSDMSSVIKQDISSIVTYNGTTPIFCYMGNMFIAGKYNLYKIPFNYQGRLTLADARYIRISINPTFNDVYIDGTDFIINGLTNYAIVPQALTRIYNKI